MCLTLQIDEQYFDWPCLVVKSLSQLMHCLMLTIFLAWYLFLSLHCCEQQVDVLRFGVNELLHTTHAINGLLHTLKRAELSAVMFISSKISVIKSPLRLPSFRALFYLIIIPKNHLNICFSSRCFADE